MNELTKNCECCGRGYSSGKNYGNAFGDVNAYKDGVKVEPKGLCPLCNVNSEYFCCKKHNTAYKIGNILYKPENNFEPKNE